MKKIFLVFPLVLAISCKQTRHYGNEFFSFECSHNFSEVNTTDKEEILLISDSVNIRIAIYNYTPKRLVIYDSISTDNNTKRKAMPGRVIIYDRNGNGREVTAGVAKKMVESGYFSSLKVQF